MFLYLGLRRRPQNLCLPGVINLPHPLWTLGLILHGRLPGRCGQPHREPQPPPHTGETRGHGSTRCFSNLFDLEPFLMEKVLRWCSQGYAFGDTE